MGAARATSGSRAHRLILLAALALAIGTAGAHPDLLAQIERLDAEIAADPENAELLLQRGDLHRRHGDFAAAEADFAAARALQPHLRALALAEGRLLLESGRPAAADQCFSQFLETTPEHAGAWNLRGHARLAQMQPERAAQDYARAIELSDAPGPALFQQQAAALVLAGTAHWPAAQQEALAAGLSHHPQDVALRGLAIDIALALGEAGAAEAAIGQLAAGLQRLPQWRRRAELAGCMAAGGPAAQVCAQQAWAALWDGVDRWQHDQPGARPAVHRD